MNWTLLFSAVGITNIKFVKVFIEQIAINANVIDTYNIKSLHSPADSDYPGKIKLLFTYKEISYTWTSGTLYTPLYFAVQAEIIPILKEILKASILDVNTKDENCKTPLHSAAKNGTIECARSLVLVLTINAKNKKENECNTPLELARR